MTNMVSRRERQTYQQLDPRDLATGNPAAGEADCGRRMVGGGWWEEDGGSSNGRRPSPETLRQMFVDGRSGREEPPRYEDLLN
jgi:hypothetical protein